LRLPLQAPLSRETPVAAPHLGTFFAYNVTIVPRTTRLTYWVAANHAPARCAWTRITLACTSSSLIREERTYAKAAFVNSREW